MVAEFDGYLKSSQSGQLSGLELEKKAHYNGHGLFQLKPTEKVDCDFF